MKPIKLEIDFFKELELPSPVLTGLVDLIESPKGVRKQEPSGRYSYALKDKLVQLYDGKPAIVTPGIYRVMVIFRRKGDLQWNHYLVVVEEDCFYPVAEFCECHDSLWIKGAIHIIKRYFAGEELDPISLTVYPKPRQKESRWGRVKR